MNDGHDPHDGIDPTAGEAAHADALARYCLALGDDALVYSYRLQHWMTRMPTLEDETTLANIALDLLGQARMLLARAGAIAGHTEDELAFDRAAQEFRNVRIVEHSDDDVAGLAIRLLVFASWRLALFESLSRWPDPTLATIAADCVKALTFHRDWATQTVVRLGGGEASRRQLQSALERTWPLVDELFASRPDEFVDPATLRAEFDVTLETVFSTAQLDRPAVAPSAASRQADPGGRDGVHDDALDDVLAALHRVATGQPEGRADAC